MDRGAWWAAVHNITKSWTRLSDWAYIRTYVHIVVKLLSHVWLFGDPMDCNPQGSSVHDIFPRREYWSGLHALLQGIFLTQGSNLCLLHWQVYSLYTHTHAHTYIMCVCVYIYIIYTHSNIYHCAYNIIYITCAYVYIHAYAYMFVYACIYTCVHICVCGYVYVHIYISTSVYTQAIQKNQLLNSWCVVLQ